MDGVSNTQITLSNGDSINYKVVNVPNTDYSKVVLEDGTVAVLVSDNGGLWASSYAYSPSKQHQCIFDSRIVLYVLSDEFKKHFNNRKITDAATKIFDDMMNSIFPHMSHPNIHCFSDVVVNFIPENTMFRIMESDNGEWIEIFDPNNYMTS